MTKTNYPIGDFLIRIKNAAFSGGREVVMAETKLIKSVAKVLMQEGFFDEVKSKSGQITVKLSYRSKKPVFMNLKLVSKPGLRVYKKANDLEKEKRPSMYLLSTPKGILTDREAIKKRIGGEVIVEIW